MSTERTRTRIGDFHLHALHEGEGAPVVLLHGLCGSHRWWRYTTPALRRERRVHLPELPGFGGSRGIRAVPDLPTMADLIGRWMDVLGVGRADVVGHSMGGEVAIHLAARQPDRVRRLVLVDASGIPRVLTRSGVRGAARRLLSRRAWGRLSFLPTIAADAARAGLRTTRQALDHIRDDDVRPLLPSIRAPTLLVWGRDDPLVPLEQARALACGIADARLIVLPGAAHDPMVDRPEAFNRELRRFLDEPGPA